MERDAYKRWLGTIIGLPNLNGGGPLMARPICEMVKARVSCPVDVAFEWCSGPGWLGFYLLEEGVCRELVLADINPDAVACASETVRKKGLGDRARVYLSDNLKDVPDAETFDLVVSNPPNYCNISPSHPLGYLRDDLRPSDVGWEIHRRFYREIGRHLKPGARMFIGEVDLDKHLTLNIY